MIVSICSFLPETTIFLHKFIREEINKICLKVVIYSVTNINILVTIIVHIKEQRTPTPICFDTPA
jgi:hypothetical protein